MSRQYDERHPDFAVVARALEGDAAATETLIQRLSCVPRIQHAENRQMGSPLGDEDLRDLAQDTLESVWRRLRSYEGRSSLETWLFTYCQHGLLEAVRRTQRGRAAFRVTDLDRFEDPSELLTTAESGRHVNPQAIDLVLEFPSDASGDEIDRATEQVVGAADALHRAHGGHGLVLDSLQAEQPAAAEVTA